MVQFNQSVSYDSSAVHGSCRSFDSSCSSVAGSVGYLCNLCIQSVYSLSLTSVVFYQTTKYVRCLLGFFTKTQGFYIDVKIFYFAPWRTTFVNIFYLSYNIGNI